MRAVIGVLLLAAGIGTVYFHIPQSRTKAEFDRTVAELAAGTQRWEAVFGEEDIAGLPPPVQNYFRRCGYIGTRKMSHIKIDYRDVDFVFNEDKRIKIDYTQYDFVDMPNRIARIDSSVFGIPFEGLDLFKDGSGAMKGVVAKRFTLFDQTGDAMDKSSQVTFLSEILLFPQAALQGYIHWESVDNLHAKATMSYGGRSVSGVFSFLENGEMRGFTTDDRSVITSDGTEKSVQWSVVFENYVLSEGIKRPTAFRAIWHYDGGDLIYFDGRGTVTAFC